VNDPGRLLLNVTGPEGVWEEVGSRLDTVAVQADWAPTRTADGLQLTLSEVAPVMHTTKAVPVPPVPTPKNVNQPDATPLGTFGSDLRGTFVPPVKVKPPPTAASPEGQATERPPALTPNDAAAEVTPVENPGPGEHMANAFTVTPPKSALTP
jgi:hypothetical protein